MNTTRSLTQSFRLRLTVLVLMGMIGLAGLIFASSGGRVAAQTDEYIVTDFYTPRGWMLNDVPPDRFDFVPLSGSNCFLMTDCVKVIWRQPQANEWIGLYWVHPDAGVGSWSQIDEPGCDFTGAATVTVWAKGENGGEKVGWLAAFYAGRRIETPSVTLTNQWAEYTIDLGTIDLTNVVGAFGYTVDGAENSGDVTFYLDKIAYQGVGPGEVTCVGSATPTATPTNTPTATATSTATPTNTPTATATSTATPTNTPTATVPSTPGLPLVLVYAGLDNNLGSDNSGENWDLLINNLELGVHDGVRVRLFVDAPGLANAFVYDLIHDENPFCPNTENISCNGRYPNVPQSEDTAHPQRLYNFIQQSVAMYPNPAQIVLVLVGHGNGWSANGLPSLPTRWGDQSEQLGGLLWDDTPGSETGTRSLATRALGAALELAVAGIGRKLDLVYMDACSMAMAEVAYQVRDSADYLLASPNTDWASFNYGPLLSKVAADKSGFILGKEWLEAEDADLRADRYPFTLALFDLQKMSTLLTATNGLADALIAELPVQRARVEQSAGPVDRYESNYDGALDVQDAYIDLNSAAIQLANHFSATSPVGLAAVAVRDAITDVIVAKAVISGTPWLFPTQTWSWQEYGGVSIYLPIPTDDLPKRLLYVDSNLQWAQDGRWDDFLAAFWSVTAASDAGIAGEAPPTCNSTTECKEILAAPLQIEDAIKKTFIPFVSR